MIETLIASPIDKHFLQVMFLFDIISFPQLVARSLAFHNLLLDLWFHWMLAELRHTLSFFLYRQIQADRNLLIPFSDRIYLCMTSFLYLVRFLDN
jgi:hypothetical protein